MHTIDLLEEAVQLARTHGWQVRYEWLDGARGGACRLGAKQLLFIDRSLTAAEQLNQVVMALRESSSAAESPVVVITKLLSEADRQTVSAELRKLLGF